MRYVYILMSVALYATTALADGSVVRYQVGEQSYEGYFISPAEKAPFILLLHDWDGLTDYEIKRAQMLNDLGYAVFAADLFGAGVRPTEVKDKKQHTGELYKDRQKMRTLLNGALEAAKEQGGRIENGVVMGYCFGGAAVLEFARSGADLKGFVTFHGGLSTPEGQDYSKTKGKILILHGTADTNITMEDFGELGEQLEQHAVDHEMITYGGAPHAFTVFGSERYREDADQKSWERFKDFLNTTVE